MRILELEGGEVAELNDEMIWTGDDVQLVGFLNELAVERQAEWEPAFGSPIAWVFYHAASQFKGSKVIDTTSYEVSPDVKL